MTQIIGSLAAYNMGFAAVLIALVTCVFFLTAGLSLARYIFQALGTYTIAQRRGIRHAWMAWLPVADMWILGSIADQYRYVTKGQIRSRRKGLLCLAVITGVLGLVLLGAYAAVLVSLIPQLPVAGYIHQILMAAVMSVPVLWLMGIYGVFWMTTVVVRHICLYDFYASCDPKSKGLYTVLSVLLPVTVPFLVFACRKQDRGMPPRKKPSSD